MRRLMIECSVKEFSKFMEDPSLQKVKLMEVLSVLKYSDEEVAVVCRLEFKDPASMYEDVFGPTWGEAQLLERESEGTYIYFIKSRPQVKRSDVDPLVIGGYLSTPYEIRDGKVKVTFLGSSKQIKDLMAMVKRTGVGFKVVSLTDAKFPPTSPLNALTEKQREVLIAAYRSGYYDVPRRTSSESLAKKIGIRAPTLVMHRRKAERRLLEQLIG